MASKFPTDGDVQLKSRKGHDLTWSCDKHGEPIKFFCKEHVIPLCHPCATKDHGQRPCHLEDIEDVILEKGRKLDDQLLRIEKTKPNLVRQDSEIRCCSNFLSDHFRSINEKVSTACDDQIKNVIRGKKKDEIRLINAEADEEIRIINEKRDKRIKACHDKTELQENAIKEMQAKLMLECKEVQSSLGRKLEDLQRKNQHQIDTVNNISLKIKRLKQDDQALVKKTPQVLAALNAALNADFGEDMAQYLAKMQRDIQDVKLVDGLVCGQYFARIDYQEAKWELVKLIPIPSTVSYPLLCGLIRDDAMCVLDSKTNDLHVTNMKNGHTEKVLEGSANIRITSCAPLDTSTIVCGKRRFDGKGGFADGCITLYDRQWRRVKDIVIPEENAFHNELWVDVDNDGRILAAQEDHYNVYLINPVSGKTIDTVELPGLETDVHDGIQAISRGNFGTCIGYAKFWVFDRSGSVVGHVYDHEWGQSWFTVDKLTETIYITYKDQRQIAEVDQLSGDRYVVDEVSRDGTKHHKKVLEYANPHRAFKVGASFFSPSGELINCDGNKLLMYKKIRNV